jgi:hypothetical protein
MNVAAKGRLVVDAGGAEPDAEVMGILNVICEEMGYDVVLGPVKACETCGFFDCVCQIRKDHKVGCRVRQAAECPISVECEHGVEVCPICDACDCR